MRVRFAPSPTGLLHIGSARTALYNWLLARGPAVRGEEPWTLVLRIEDTDRERSTPENVEQILDALRWLELNWDEGPIMQTDRDARHREAIAQLIADGHAYYSTATGEDVKAYKAEHGNDRGYRGVAADAAAAGSAAVRLHVPDDGVTSYDDAVRGTISFPNASMDDPVIARADGSVLYNFAVAVDDLDAGIDIVLRGDDHISNTPKQLLVIEALGATPPTYAHMPMILGPDGKKLSKRHGAASVQELRDAGYLPEAVDNYVALLGAGYGTDEEIFSLDELARRFSLDRVSKNPAVFDEKKLRHINGIYIRELGIDELTRRLEEFTGRSDLRGAVEISAEKIQTLADFWPLAGFLFDGPGEDPKAVAKVFGRDGAWDLLEAARDALGAVEPFTVESIDAALRELVEARGCKPGELFQPIRVAIAGTTVSPGIFETVALLGRDETLRRIDAALAGR
jgi:glutamyl-tRNA synthetase